MSTSGNNKAIHSLLMAIFLAVFISGMNSCEQKAAPQKTQTGSQVLQKLNTRSFEFVAEAVYPFRGTIRILTSKYDVKVSGDSVLSFLPYFGNATTAPTSQEEAGIMFTSKKFEFNLEPGKKSAWEVLIKFNDQLNTQQFRFSVLGDGSTILYVTSNFRDPVSFRGNIH